MWFTKHLYILYAQQPYYHLLYPTTLPYPPLLLIQAMPLTKDISNMPTRTAISTDKKKNITDNKKQKISDNKFFMKQNSESETLSDAKKNDKFAPNVSSSSAVEVGGRGRGRKPLAPTPPKRPILLRG